MKEGAWGKNVNGKAKLSSTMWANSFPGMNGKQQQNPTPTSDVVSHVLSTFLICNVMKWNIDNCIRMRFNDIKISNYFSIIIHSQTTQFHHLPNAYTHTKPTCQKIKWKCNCILIKLNNFEYMRIVLARSHAEIHRFTC